MAFSLALEEGEGAAQDTLNPRRLLGGLPFSNAHGFRDILAERGRAHKKKPALPEGEGGLWGNRNG
jgi:hypothetical protein